MLTHQTCFFLNYLYTLWYRVQNCDLVDVSTSFTLYLILAISRPEYYFFLAIGGHYIYFQDFQVQNIHFQYRPM